MNKKTFTALQGSIAKWEAIAKGEGFDGGSEDCPLCIALKYEGHYEGHSDCTKCPVMQRTGKDYCKDSPYVAWGSSLERIHGSWVTGSRRVVMVNGVKNKTLVRRARDEVKFLKSLLPNDL